MAIPTERLRSKTDGHGQAEGKGAGRAASPTLDQQRKSLPDEPGVYLFRDAERRVLYVGKAKSLRKRVASHFGKPTAGKAQELIGLVDQVDFVATRNEADALIAEQSLIKQHRPRFNIQLRDDKSYPFIGISLDEEFPRVYFTRERRRSGRVYFGPFSNAKRVRETLELLGKVFRYRTCDGPKPGRATGNPCLDYYIKRCQAPCMDYISKEDYRRSIDAIVAFLSGHYREIERDLEERMRCASAERQFEQAALYRDRLEAVRSLFRHERVVKESTRSMDIVAVEVDGSDANAQVFQIREGVLAGRHSFYLQNLAAFAKGEVAEQFALQYYGHGGVALPPTIVVQKELRYTGALQAALGENQEDSVRVAHAARGERRRLLELAERNATLALAQDKLRAEHRRRRRVEALDGLREAFSLETIPVRLECFDISNLGSTHTVASMVVFEGGAPNKAHYRRFNIRSLSGQDDFAAMEEVLGRRLARYEAEHDRSPHDAERDESFAALPDVIVIDGGRGQLSSGLKALKGFRERGVVVASLAKRIEEVFLPSRRRPLRLSYDSAALQLLQRLRDEAHRFAVQHHRKRRTRAMKSSIFDELPGIGPARKRLLLRHFGSPDRFMRASREELEAVRGLPGKVARQVHQRLNKAG